MFSNIIGQENVIEKLRTEISSNIVPNSIIFSGPKYSGKLTTALEFFRVLNCKKDKKQDCNCQNCFFYHNFNLNNLVLLSKRSYFDILFELFQSYKQEKSSLVQSRIIYYIKLTMFPFNEIFINEVLSDVDKKKVENYFEYLNDIIDKNEFSSVDSEEILKVIKNINLLFKSDNISVNLLRKTIEWAYFSSKTDYKVVIIDNADSLEISSENILLKTLEEPPSYLFFILLVKNKYDLLETIRSRCRIYNFNEHKSESINYIIKNHFNSLDLNYSNIFDFIHRNDSVNNSLFFEKLDKLYYLIFDNNKSFTDLFNFFDREKDEMVIYNLLLKFYDKYRKNIINGNIKHSELVYKTISENFLVLINKIDKYNLNIKNNVEAFFFSLKEFFINDNK